MGIENGHSKPHLTPTWQRIMEILRDGGAHTEKELMTCLDDPLAKSNALAVHMSHLRRELKNFSQGILRECINGVNYYRLVRYLANPYS